MAVISHAWMHINATRAHCGQQLSSAIAESPSLADACIALGWWTLTSPVLFTGVHVIGVTQIWLVCFLELPARSRLRDDLLYKLHVFFSPSWNDRLYPCASVKMCVCENSSSQFTTPSTFFFALQLQHQDWLILKCLCVWVGFPPLKLRLAYPWTLLCHGIGSQWYVQLHGGFAFISLNNTLSRSNQSHSISLTLSLSLSHTQQERERARRITFAR